MSISTQPPPATLHTAVTPRLRIVLQGLSVLAAIGFAVLGLGLLEGSLDPAAVYLMAGCGYTALVMAGGLRLKARPGDRPPVAGRFPLWLLYLGAIVLLLPPALIAGGSLLFFLWAVQMVSDPGYRPMGPPMTAPVGDLLLSAAALVALVWLLAYALYEIRRDY
jgi:predicted Co/Zn/Cd cation transporter (cation efflux family)